MAARCSSPLPVRMWLARPSVWELPCSDAGRLHFATIRLDCRSMQESPGEMLAHSAHGGVRLTLVDL